MKQATPRTDADDDVRRLLRPALEVVLKDLFRARRIARLRVERRARVVWHHAVPAAQRVLHVPPRVVLRRGLHVPHVARVAAELPGLERGGDVCGVADRAARGVHDPRALLEVREELGVDETFGAVVEGRVDRDDITLDEGLDMRVTVSRGSIANLGDEVLDVLNTPGADLRGSV